MRALGLTGVRARPMSAGNCWNVPAQENRPTMRLCGTYLALSLTLSTAAAPALAQSTPGSGPTIPVTVTHPVRKDVPVSLRGLGQVVAFNSVLIRSRVDGTIDKVFFTEGQDVKAGELLVQIDPRPYQAALDQSVARKAADEAALGSAKQDLRRSTQLAVNQFAAQQLVDQRTAQVQQLEAAIKGDDAAIDAAKLNLDFTRITAPFDGRVGLRNVDPGNFVRAADPTGQGIVTVSQVKPISVTFTLPQDQLPTVTGAMAKGRPTVLAYNSDDTTQLGEGELLTIDNTIDATTGTIKLKATFPNPGARLWPGQFVNARLIVDVRKGALTVPSAAIQRGPNGMFVFVVKPDQTAAVRLVDVAQDTGGTAVIAKGLEESDMVVMSGQSRLSNNARVSVTEAPPA